MYSCEYLVVDVTTIEAMLYPKSYSFEILVDDIAYALLCILANI